MTKKSKSYCNYTGTEGGTSVAFKFKNSLCILFQMYRPSPQSLINLIINVAFGATVC